MQGGGELNGIGRWKIASILCDTTPCSSVDGYQTVRRYITENITGDSFHSERNSVDTYGRQVRSSLQPIFLWPPESRSRGVTTCASFQQEIQRFFAKLGQSLLHYRTQTPNPVLFQFRISHNNTADVWICRVRARLNFESRNDGW